VSGGISPHAHAREAGWEGGRRRACGRCSSLLQVRSGSRPLPSLSRLRRLASSSRAPAPRKHHDHPRPLLHLRQGARGRWALLCPQAAASRSRRRRGAPPAPLSHRRRRRRPALLRRLLPHTRPLPSPLSLYLAPLRSSATSGTPTWSCCRPTTRRREFRRERWGGGSHPDLRSRLQFLLLSLSLLQRRPRRPRPDPVLLPPHADDACRPDREAAELQHAR